MSSANALRRQIEASLSQRIPAALSPAPKTLRPVAPVGIQPVDELLRGGLPVGALTELIGPECSGRTSLALSFVAGLAGEGKVCAWVDVLDTLSPESAAANGVDLRRLLWVRCGVPDQATAAASSATASLPQHFFSAPAPIRGLHGGGGGQHPRTEINGLPEAVGGFLRPEQLAPRCAEPQRRPALEEKNIAPVAPPRAAAVLRSATLSHAARVDQALRVTDLVLQAGGFAAIVLDFGGIDPQVATRVPLATWFRYRAAAEKTQSSILLLSRHACSNSSAGLVLRLASGDAVDYETTVFSGLRFRVTMERERFQPAASNVVPMRKPPQREAGQIPGAAWQSRPAGQGVAG